MTEQEIVVGQKHLSSADTVLAAIIAQVPVCTLRPQGEPYRALTRAIVGQQISTQAANTIWGRFCALCAPDEAPTPDRVLATPDETLSAAGLSRAKVVYVKDLASHFSTGSLAPDTFASLSDEEIITDLTRVRGIGRWTAEMFLIFSLGRPDVLPVDDLGFQNAVQRAYGLPTRPTPARLREHGEPWRPYRSLATWYLWQSLTLSAST